VCVSANLFLISHNCHVLALSLPVNQHYCTALKLRRAKDTEQKVGSRLTTLRSRPQTGFNRPSPLRRIYDSTDLINPVDYVESTASTELCLLHHLFYCRFVRAFAHKNDTLNGECLNNVPSLRFKPDPMDVNAMFFLTIDSTMIQTNTLSEKHRVSKLP
jgi:hypothetical protein